MQRRLLSSTVVIWVLTISIVAWGDWITLKDGVQIHGDIVRKTDKEVSLKSSTGGILTFKRQQVAEIHELNPAPEETPDEQEDRPIWLREAAVGRDLFRRIFGKATLIIPRTCQKVLGRGEYPGYEGEVLGLYEQEKSGVTVCMTRGSLPLKAKSFLELRSRLVRSLVQKKRRVLKFESRPLDQLSAYVAETEETVDNTTLVHVEAWIEVADDTIYTVHITVPQGLWNSDPYRFRGILRSFEHHPHAPEPRRNP